MGQSTPHTAPYVGDDADASPKVAYTTVELKEPDSTAGVPGGGSDHAEPDGGGGDETSPVDVPTKRKLGRANVSEPRITRGGASPEHAWMVKRARRERHIPLKKV